MSSTVHPPTWWYRWLSVLSPGRCREVPHADDPDRVLIRQFAIWKRRAYLQQFASGENPEYLHTHPWKGGTIAIGLSGELLDQTDARPGRATTRVSAPYLRYMGPGHVHQTVGASPGHTSIFIGLGRKTDDKFYILRSGIIRWSTHVQRLVKRI